VKTHYKGVGDAYAERVDFGGIPARAKTWRQAGGQS